jgi:hypothetical protein
MASMLDELPIEIISRILRYVPNRSQAALVCKPFYEEICKIERDCYELSLDKVNTFVWSLKVEITNKNNLSFAEVHRRQTEKHH